MARRIRIPRSALLVLAVAVVVLGVAAPALAQYPITTNQPPTTTTVLPPAPAPAPLIVAPRPHAKVAGVTETRDPAAPAAGELAFTGMATAALVATAVWLFALGANLSAAARRRAAARA